MAESDALTKVSPHLTCNFSSHYTWYKLLDSPLFSFLVSNEFRSNLKGLYKGDIYSIYNSQKTICPSKPGIVCWMGLTGYQAAIVSLGNHWLCLYSQRCWEDPVFFGILRVTKRPTHKEWTRPTQLMNWLKDLWRETEPWQAAWHLFSLTRLTHNGYANFLKLSIEATVQRNRP